MKTHLDDLLQRFQHTRVLVIGDLMLDHYIWGDVTRISPEAPVPVVRVVRETQTAGGAANVALNLSALGVNASLLGIIGEDSPGEGLLDLLRQQEVDVSPIIQRSDTPTIVKTRVLARTQQLCRIDRESGSTGRIRRSRGCRRGRDSDATASGHRSLAAARRQGLPPPPRTSRGS